MTPDPLESADRSAWAGVRTMLVPFDIVAVPRVSPVRVRKQTPWRQRPDGEPIARAGGREWFSDQLFVEADKTQVRAACGTAMTTHASCMVGLIVLLATQPDAVPFVKVGQSLVMPVMTSMMPVAEAATAVPRAREASVPRALPQPPAAAAPPAAAEDEASPIDAPSSIEAETALESGGQGTPGGVEGGVEGGVAGGVVGGVVGGVIGGGPASGGGSPGAVRLGAGMEPPRKIKDVKPLYPQFGLSSRARGAVVIEATVGVDGKVHDAVVIHSIPLLDQAALEAVRQWEFVPSRMNGVPLAVIITVIVQFAVY